ncbi:MAG: 30S ribosomal protein S20 [Dehalococcoidia bacterium]|nr:30S ribosomal protein S20 [Dehalococcoidia bacterium]
MANHKSAEKRWRQSLKRRDRNRSRRSAMRTAVRTAREAIAAGEDSTTALSAAYSSLDRAAKAGSIHTGKADRLKRRLAAAAATAAA